MACSSQGSQSDQLYRGQNNANCNASLRSHRLLGHWVHTDPDSNPGCVAVSFAHHEGILTVARYGKYFSRHPKNIAIAHATPTRDGCWLKDRYTTVTLHPDGTLELLEDHHDKREPTPSSPSHMKRTQADMKHTLAAYEHEADVEKQEKETANRAICPWACVQGHAYRGVQGKAAAADVEKQEGAIQESREESAAFLLSEKMTFERFNGHLDELLEDPRVSPSVDIVKLPSTATEGQKMRFAFRTRKINDSLMVRSSSYSTIRDESEHGLFFHSFTQTGPNRNVLDRSWFGVCVGIYMLLSSFAGAYVLLLRVWPGVCADDDVNCDWSGFCRSSIFVWVSASATLAATQLCPRITTEIGDHLIQAYMILAGSITLKGIWHKDKISSGSVTTQFGGVLHRIGGRTTLFLAVLLVTSNCLILVMSSASWLRNLGLNIQAVADRLPHMERDQMDKWMKKHMRVDTWCETYHFVPFPFVYILAKLVLGSVLQDFFFSREDKKNLYEQLEERVQWKTFLFFVWRMVSLILACVQTLKTPPPPTDTDAGWEHVQYYSWAVYLLTQKGAVLSCFQLIAKLFVETNVEEDGTPPEVYHALSFLSLLFLRNKNSIAQRGTHLEIPSFRQGGKAQLLWAAVAFIFPVVVCALPLIIGAYLYIIYVVTFPIWGSALALILLVRLPDPLKAIGTSLITGRRIDSYGVLQDAAEAHLTLWGYWSLMLALGMSATYMRAKIWRCQTRWHSKGESPDGKVGYLTLATTILWTLLVVIILQSYVAWGSFIVVFKGDGNIISDAALMEFNSRQIVQYNNCVYNQSQKAWHAKGQLLIQIMGWT